MLGANNRPYEVLQPDQLGDLRPFNQTIENIAEASAVLAAGRGREANELRVGIVIDDIAIGARRDVVSLIDEHDVSRRSFTATVQRLDRGHLHAARGVDRVTGQDDARLDAEQHQLVAGLMYELAAMGDEKDVPIDGLPDDFGGDERLARAGCQCDQRASLFLCGGDKIVLIRSKLNHRSPPRAPYR